MKGKQNWVASLIVECCNFFIVLEGNIPLHGEGGVKCEIGKPPTTFCDTSF